VAQTIFSIEDKIVPVEAIQKLVEGSYEQLTGRLDEAVEASRSVFTDTDEDIARLATFRNRVVVGTAGGAYYEAKFESKDGVIVIGEAKQLDVPVISSTNAARSIRDYSLSIVDALMSEGTEGAGGQMIQLASLQEQKQVEMARDYVGETLAALSEGRPWRQVFAEQSDEIRRQIVDVLESINENSLDAKYKPLYETDEIPEEKFEDYREMAETDLRLAAERMEQVHHTVESVYFPFIESVGDADLEEDESNVLSHFCFFAEDLVEDLQEVRSIVSDALVNEQCVMCLGHIYDSIAESLSSYEMAASFVERMVGAFDGAS
jgi:hypothetical protein